MNRRKPLAKLPSRAPRSSRREGEFRGYGQLVSGITEALQAGRKQAAWSLNSIMSAVYWDIGRRIVEFEQRGDAKAEYGERVIARLAEDLHATLGRGFQQRNLYQFRKFYLTYRNILQTPSAKSLTTGNPLKASREPAAPKSKKKAAGILQTPSGKSPPDYLKHVAGAFTLPWSHYARLLSVQSDEARRFYETEALRGGWSFRELDRQLSSQLYERLALSRNKVAVLRKANGVRPPETLAVEEELRDPLVLEFLNLEDEYSESDLEAALIRHLGQFLSELGNDFCFAARQRRLRIGNEWYRVDLLFFHRKLRCLVVIDLKVGKFTHADAGQMHLYLNYTRQHWTHPQENPPVGLILCTEKDEAVAKYALEGLPNKVLAREYKLALPDERKLAAEITKTRAVLDRRSRRIT